MKIGYLGKGYPYKRCVINKTDSDYIWVNRRYNILYAWYKVTSKIKEKILKTALHHAISHDKETVDNKDVEYALKASKIKNSEVKGMFE